LRRDVSVYVVLCIFLKKKTTFEPLWRVEQTNKQTLDVIVDGSGYDWHKTPTDGKVSIGVPPINLPVLAS